MFNFLIFCDMCIICIKKKGIKFPSEKRVKNMCDNNHDGFSIVIAHGNERPKIYKSMNEKKFLELYHKIYTEFDAEDTSMFIHARIKTHGTPRLENCHGWRENGLIFAHNGILRIENRDDLTDSETYFRDIFSPAYRCGGWQMAERTINAIIGTSKFVFMDEAGEIRHFGNYIEDDGCLFSNESYKTWKERYPSAYRNLGTTPYRHQRLAQTIDDEEDVCGNYRVNYMDNDTWSAFDAWLEKMK